MSVLFPKVQKPREWDYRPIYYDEQKEARKQKLARLHQGSLHQEYERSVSAMQHRKRSRLLLLVALLAALILIYCMLS